MIRTEIRRAAVIGGGAMGTGIALELALSGREVTLFNTRAETGARALEQLRRDLAQLVDAGLISQARATAALGRVRRTTQLSEAVEGQDYVAESVPENLPLKQQVFAELDRLAAPDVLLASNTTALSVTALARDCAHPERVLAVHYYLPAHLLPLVDIVPGERTSPQALDAAKTLMESLGKSPVVFTRDVPGTVGPRLQTALLGEAFRLVQEGVASPEIIDRVLTQGIGRRFGVTGLFDRLDLAGLDTVAGVLKAQGKPVPPVLAEKVERGELGLKSGQGFYSWSEAETRAFQERVARHLMAQLVRDRDEGRARPFGGEER